MGRKSPAIGIGLSLLFAAGLFAGPQGAYAGEPPAMQPPVTDAPAAPAVKLRVPQQGFRRIVTYGDSIAHGIGRYVDTGQTGGLTVRDYAIPGAGLRNARVIAALQKIRQGDLVIVSVGTNDLVNMLADPAYSLEGYARQVRGLLRDIRARGAEPVLLGLNSDHYNAHYEKYGITDEQWNREIKTLNAELQAMAAHEQVVFSRRAPGGSRADGSYVPLAGDGLHYSREGYQQVFANLVKDAGLGFSAVPRPAPVLRPGG